MTLQIGIVLALLCALATNLGFLFKHRGACAAPDVSMRHPLRSAIGLFRSKWFAIGMLVAVGAWSLHVGALALAPLSVGHAGALGLLSPWLLTCVIASVIAFYASARGLQKGEAVPVITLTSAAANVSAISGGIIVFGDPMPSDPLGVAVQTLAFVMVI